MLKALKKGIKKLGSSNKLQEAAGAPDEAAAVAAAPAVAASQVAHGPPGLPRPPSPLVQQQKEQQHRQLPTMPPVQQPGPAGALPAAATAAEGGTRPASPLQHEELGGGMVDYELVAGPLELDTADEGETQAGASCSYATTGSTGGAEEHPAVGTEQLPRVCYGSGDHSGSLAAAAAAQEAEAAAQAAADEQGCQGGDAEDAGGAVRHGAAASDGAAAAAGGGGGEISEALAAMMYLTDDAEGNDDCVSVVSDALSDDNDFPDDISELSRALEALEGEALAGSSPGAPSADGAAGTLEEQLAGRLGISPEADPSAFAQQMAKLYNNLGLKMMERRRHEEALGLLRKAEAVVENSAMWHSGAASQKRRARMQAITYNNLGCLFKRRSMPQLALQHLQKALALEEAMGGSVQNRSSTHLNICAAFSALKRPKEALSHAERAIILLQRALWAHQLNFQDGLSVLVRQLAVPGAARTLLGSANVLAMAYHNAAVEHEKLGRLREALVSFTRAYLVSSKCLGHKAPMTVNLSKALKAFQQRQARYLPTGAAHAARKAPSLATRGSAAANPSKRSALTHSRPTKTAGAAKSGGSSSNLSKATLPLDKGRTTTGAGMGTRAPSASRLATALQQQQQAGF